MVTLHRRRVKSAVYQWDKGRRTYSKGIQKEYKKIPLSKTAKNTKKTYANKLFLQNRVSKHYAHNPFFRKTQFGTFFHQSKSGHKINVQLSKNFFETQIDFSRICILGLLCKDFLWNNPSIRNTEQN